MTKTQLKKATKIIYDFEADSKILKQIARWIPRRNTLSNANTKRDPAMAEDVFWGLFRHLSAIEPDFDQHQLIGLLAPRLAYVSAATLDPWAGPYGEFLSARDASAAWREFGRDGIADGTQFPEPDAPVFGDGVGYHLRAGVHTIAASDWDNWISFAEKEMS